MRFLEDLRQHLFDLRKRVFQRKRKRIPVPITPGLPEELPPELIAEVCRAHFGAMPTDYRQQHLSGWKTTGAYRIFAALEDGREARLVYKIAIYNPEDIPALSGLPIQPGPAEYAILSHAGGPLASYLPCIYLAEVVTPGARYRYIMEDLGTDYRRAIDEERIRRAGGLFPVFHDALARWDPNEQAGLIQYGEEFSAALQAYALPRLERYIAQQESPAVRELLKAWVPVTRTHLKAEFFEGAPHALIHGDPNYSNVYLHETDPRKMKLVDWEWAGFGSPYADLVSLLKGAPSHLERWAVGQMATHLHQPVAEALRQYAWCHLERGLLDAAFLSVQALGTTHKTRFSLHNAVTSSARRVLRAYRQLG